MSLSAGDVTDPSEQSATLDSAAECATEVLDKPSRTASLRVSVGFTPSETRVADVSANLVPQLPGLDISKLRRVGSAALTHTSSRRL